MPGACIGQAAKATATYLRYELNAPDRKLSQFFSHAMSFGQLLLDRSPTGCTRKGPRMVAGTCWRLTASEADRNDLAPS